MSRPRAASLLAFITVALGAILIAAPAAAHPLGNFSVNHYHGLRLHGDGVDDLAVLDEAEIPTLQQRSTVDSDGDGTVTDGERQAYADHTCRDLADALALDVDRRSAGWAVRGATFGYLPGAANLQTGRTECRLHAAIPLHDGVELRLDDGYRSDRVGWHEITATGDGVSIADSPVPTASITDELRHYPTDVLTSPLDRRSVALRIGPGPGPVGDPVGGPAATRPLGGPIGRALGALTNQFYSLVGAPRFGPLVGLLGVAMALLLGAAHAALPGHGKTVMAAYIAGRRGTFRDAITVGATVTMTHTAGVLVVGLLLVTVSGLVGELVLGWLGLLSGLLIAGVGAGLLRSATKRRRTAPNAVPAPRSDPAPALVAVGPPDVHRGHPPDPAGADPPVPHGHDHGHSHGGHHHHHGHRIGRGGLVGLGIAGGLVPSPSALVVLLGAVALGRTWFGVLLVLAYGLGMAATLTAAGLILVRVRRRLDAATTGRFTSGRWGLGAAAILRWAPMWTAALVLVVGLALALQAALPLLS